MDIFILYLIIIDSYGAHSIETYLNRPEKDGRVFSSQSVFGWSRSHFSWMGGEVGGRGKLEGGANTATPHRNTYKHRTEEHKETENRTGITQKFLNTGNCLVL